jgi:molybdenum cofactor guanylyltransferase
MQNPFPNYPLQAITAVVLAGGRGQRMGGQDKGLLPVRAQTLISYVLARLRDQAGVFLINANRNLEIYQSFGLPLVSDEQQDFRGPLAGIAAALRVCHTPYLLCAPCDAPLLPLDLGPRLYAALGDAKLCVAHDGARYQPMFALIRRELLDDLEDFLASGGRTVMQWYDRHALVADFSDAPRDAFHNANTPEEHRYLEQILC